MNQSDKIVYKEGNPWPFYKLSDGTLLSIKGRVYVRCLVDLKVERTRYGEPTKLKPLALEAKRTRHAGSCLSIPNLSLQGRSGQHPVS